MQKELLFQHSGDEWQLINIDESEVTRLAQELNLEPLLARILLAYDIDKAHGFDPKEVLRPDFSLNHQYRGITDDANLDRAIERLIAVCNSKGKVMVNGDSDADGISACSVVVAGLSYFGAEVFYDFPVRSVEGHGLQVRIIDEAKAKGCEVIVTTDCGTKDTEAVTYANSLGLDVIVTDHHILGKELPEAFAVVNPYLIKHVTPEQKLAGAGVAFKLMMGLSDRLKREFPNEFYKFLVAVAALGTISDRMSMKEPINRAIAIEGVKALNETQSAGLRALRDVSVQSMPIKPREISRTISPRLNAPGRIGNPAHGIPDANVVVDLILLGLKGVKQDPGSSVKKFLQKFIQVVDYEKAVKEGGDMSNKEARLVEEVNDERKKITEKIEIEIQAMLNRDDGVSHEKVLMLKGYDWNSGVIGIDADRLRDRYQRPAVIVTEYTGYEFVKGSVRSVPKINMYAILETVQEKFQEKFKRNIFSLEVDTEQGKRRVNAFGGHAQACGFTMHRDDYDVFCEMVRTEMETLEDELFTFSYSVVDKIKFADIGTRFLQRLEGLSPYGEKFDFPLFLLENVEIGKFRPFGNKYQEGMTPHLEFAVTEVGKERGKQVFAAGFGLYEKVMHLKESNSQFDLLVQLDSGRRGKGVRLLVQDIRPKA